MIESGTYEAVAIGVSAGGIAALEKILPRFAPDCGLVILVVQHMSPGGGHYLVEHFSSVCHLPVKEASDKEKSEAGTIYFAPADYHLLVEKQRTLALSMEAKVHYCRPSIDVLFETAAEAYSGALAGVILTGANRDGARGLARVKQLGGLSVVQSPETAEVDIMPRAAMDMAQVDCLLPLDRLGDFLAALNRRGKV